MNNIFIPIKEHSERVPNKNFRLFGNKPLYQHTIDKLSEFNVFVDTDSIHLKNELLKRYTNVQVNMRRKDLVGDKVSVCDIMLDVIQNFNITGNLLQMHVTSPFLNTETINKSFNIIENTEYDSVVSCEILQTRLWRYDNSILTPLNHNPIKLERSQDLKKVFVENSAFYLLNTEFFIRTKMRVGENPYFFQIPFPENIDIDNEDDWDLSCKILQIRNF